jgi:hypothetical protein
MLVRRRFSTYSVKLARSHAGQATGPVAVKRYTVRVHGYGIRVKMGRQTAVGFFVNRFVEAQSADEAKRLAVSMIRELPRLQATIPKEERDALTLDVQEIVELDEDAELPDTQQGLIFYPEQKQN